MHGGFQGDRPVASTANNWSRSFSDLAQRLQGKQKGKKEERRREPEREGKDEKVEEGKKVKAVSIRAVKMALEETTEGNTATMEGPRAANHLSLAASSTEQSG